MTLEESGYRGVILNRLNELSIRLGDSIIVEKDGSTFTGFLMPRSQVGSDQEHIVIKMENGYNIGIRIDDNCVITKGKTQPRKGRGKPRAFDQEKNLPTISILSTGGTIASKVDYQTGAVNPALTAQDLYETVPELGDYANIRAKVLMSALSENITPSDWTKIAKSTASEIRKDVEGVVIAHGTDTLGYTAAALSFALRNLPVPIALVGSQRSSDRPSSDSALNLIGAIKLVKGADVAEVMVVMHGETNDSFLLAHRGTRVRKCHSSRRDAFQSINAYPLYRVHDDSIEEISEPLLRRDKNRRLLVKPKFEERVALIKTYPGMDGVLLETIVDSGIKGLIIEGTGLGHAPDVLRKGIAKAIDSGVVVGMTTQCIHGRVNMNVYRTGVHLLEMGVVPCEDMIPETALVKLMWVLANSKDVESAKNALTVPLAGEMHSRSEYPFYNADEGRC